MKKLRVFVLMFVAVLGFSAVAFSALASDGGSDEGLLCTLFPVTCGATTNGGNGGGEQPPKPD